MNLIVQLAGALAVNDGIANPDPMVKAKKLESVNLELMSKGETTLNQSAATLPLFAAAVSLERKKALKQRLQNIVMVLFFSAIALAGYGLFLEYGDREVLINSNGVITLTTHDAVNGQLAGTRIAQLK